MLLAQRTSVIASLNSTSPREAGEVCYRQDRGTIRININSTPWGRYVTNDDGNFAAHALIPTSVDPYLLLKSSGSVRGFFFCKKSLYCNTQ